MFVKAFLKSFTMIFADLVAGCLTFKHALTAFT